jgi:hypothetical protein
MPKTDVGHTPDPTAVKTALRAMALGRRSSEAERAAHQDWREAAAEDPDPKEMSDEQIDDEMLRLALRVSALVAEEDRRSEPVWRPPVITRDAGEWRARPGPPPQSQRSAATPGG